jgi:hypothetical protein
MMPSAYCSRDLQPQSGGDVCEFVCYFVQLQLNQAPYVHRLKEEVNSPGCGYLGSECR